MPTTIQVTNLSKSFSQPLFGGVNLRGSAPSKIAIIGDNGSGKSTFLKVLADIEPVDSGAVIWSKGAKIGYLEQEVLNGPRELSGGEKKILRISQLFYSDYDALLLDEPDNHLDLDHKLWFEQLIKSFSGLVVVISHDRAFLESGIERIWLLEEKQIREYPFGYKKFREIYEGEMASREHLWEVQEKERKRLLDIVERFRVKASHNSNLAGSYHGAVKRHERFVANMVEKSPTVKTLGLKSNLGKQPKRKTAIHIKDLDKSFGENQVLKGLNLHVFCGEKIAINAPNGAGKSTLLNIITGKFEADSGEVYLGPGLRVGSYTQEHLESLDEHETPIGELQNTTSFSWYDAISYLKRFLFTEDQAKTEVRFLSGGQKSRLQLAKFLSTNPDVLILDEPTNHLDLRTVISLERFLKEYQGTLILVSHDRKLVNNVANKIYQMEQGKLLEI